MTESGGDIEVARAVGAGIGMAARPDFAAAAAGIGLALYLQDSQSEADLVEIADHQMYRNKRARKAGRGFESEPDPHLQSIPFSTR